VTYPPAIAPAWTRRRLLALSLAATSTAALTAACGNQATESAPTAALPPARISYLLRGKGDRPQRFKELVALFNQEFPTIEVELATPATSNADTSILVRHQAGDPVDAYDFGQAWFVFQEAGAAIDLTDRFKRDKIDTAKFIPEPIHNNTVDGKLYGLPVSVGSDAWGYNLDMLERAGLKPPPADPTDKSWTVEKFLEYATKLTRPGEQWGFGGDNNGGETFYHDATFWGAGPWDEKTRKMTVNTPTFRQGLEFWRDLANKYAAQPTTTEMRQLTGTHEELLKSGRIGFQTISNGIKPDFRWGLASLPYSGPGSNVSGRLGLSSIYMGPGKQLDATWRFVSWFSRPDPGSRFVWMLGQAVSPLLDDKASDLPMKAWRESYGADPKALLLQARHSKIARWGLSRIRNWDAADKDIQASYARFRAGEISTDQLVQDATRIGTAAIAAST
jgi:ABC-type glycerol-3-phosphate transport system substrate-binding protein